MLIKMLQLVIRQSDIKDVYSTIFMCFVVYLNKPCTPKQCFVLYLLWNSLRTSIAPFVGISFKRISSFKKSKYFCRNVH